MSISCPDGVPRIGIGIHTANALRGFEVGRLARDRGAFVVFGGIHATLYPGEAQECGGAHSVVLRDGDVIWVTVLANSNPAKAEELRKDLHAWLKSVGAQMPTPTPDQYDPRITEEWKKARARKQAAAPR